MTAIISFETAQKIAFAHSEMRAARTLIEQIKQKSPYDDLPDIRDDFGGRRGALQLGVPSGNASHRLYNVDYNLAVPILEAHVAKQYATILSLTQQAIAEANGAGAEGNKP